jgi:hypothetical protein
MNSAVFLFSGSSLWVSGITKSTCIEISPADSGQLAFFRICIGVSNWVS